jgi:glucose-6-phosphate isomerase
MSVIRPKPPTEPLQVDLSSAFAAGGLEPRGLALLAPRLEAARADLLAVLLATLDRPRPASGDDAGERAGAETAGLDLPDRLLGDYMTRRPQSDLYAILQAAHRIRDEVDRLIVIGAGGCLHGPRLLFETCCHPLHNELARGERGGRPRLSFTGTAFDNDLVQGLLDLVAPAGRPRSDDLLDRWAMLVADRGAAASAPSTALTTRLFLAALDETRGGDASRRAERLIPIAARSSRLAAVGRAVGCRHAFAIDPALPEACLVFTAAGLLPAAIAGIDVVRFLEGAAAVTRRFREAPAEVNPVLQIAAGLHLAAGRGMHVQMVATPGTRLEAVSRWHDACVQRGVAGGAGGMLDMHLAVGAPRRDPLVVPAVGALCHDADGLDALVGRPWPDVASAAGPDAAAGEARRPPVTILLPRVDEHAVGQLVQLQILAAAIARRLAAAGACPEPLASGRDP